MTSLIDRLKWYRARPGRFDDKIAEIEALLAPCNLADLGGTLPPDLPASCFSIAQTEAPRVKRTVVAEGYKRRYAEAGDPRSCGDWLARSLASLCQGAKGIFDVKRFEAILDQNGVRHEHWNRTTPGWQGRLRMSGRISLTKRIVEANAFLVGETQITPPFDWIVQHGG